MKNVTLMLIVCVFAMKASAQDATDALRYSQITFGGTARGMGLAGAVGSLGADVTDLSVNPAGLGLYRSSEVEITPTLFMLNNSTSYFGTSSTTNDNRFGIENFGMVFTHKVGQPYGRSGRRGGYRTRSAEPTPSTSKWKTTSFAIAYNRLNNFNENFYYTGYNPNNSRADSWAQEANNNGWYPSQMAANDPFGAYAAFYTFVIDGGPSSFPNDTTPPYSSKAAGGVKQSEITNITGSQNEFDLSFGANYNDKLFLGLTLGIPTIDYNSISDYNEVSANNTPNDFQSYDYQYQLNTSGTGINVKFGVIYKINDYLRLGAAIHTPTWYSMQDLYSSYMSANIFDSTGSNTINYQYNSPNGSYSYNLETPWRFVGSATILFKQYGFLSADYEYVDYSQASYDFSQSGNPADITTQNQLNQSIQTAFAPASIFRVGAEFAYDIFRIRGGFAYYGTPYQSGQAGQGGNQSVENITGGVGLRLDHVFIDAAYVYSLTNATYYPYALDATQAPYTASPYVTEKNTTGNVVLTIGYKF